MLYTNEFLTSQQSKPVNKEEKKYNKKSKINLKKESDFDKFRKFFLRSAKNDPCFGCIN